MTNSYGRNGVVLNRRIVESYEADIARWRALALAAIAVLGALVAFWIIG